MATLKVYDASVAQEWAALSTDFSKKKEWIFFTQPGVTSTVLGLNLLARKAYNAKMKTEMFYVGRKARGVSSTSVEFSNYEGDQIVKLIETIQVERDEQLELGKSDFEVILKFNGREISKEVVDTKSLSFWQSPIEQLHSVRIRVSFNQVLGAYQLSLNSPVTADVSAKYKGWPGPTIDFTYSEMDELVKFIQSN